jgi:circadian clock protein KaiC
LKGQGRVAYVTLLSESHSRMVTQMKSMSFYEEAHVGSSLIYVNGFAALEADGLDGLLKMLRATVREQKADLLVLDGLLSASALSKTPLDYKKFINELQSWIGVVGCTVLFLTNGGPGASVEPEYTMVDGIVELRSRRVALRRLRELSIRKFRGTAVLEGAHPYQITGDGLIVYPRVEAQLDSYPRKAGPVGFLSSGIDGLDALLGGGFRAGSATVVLGPSGTGKTTLGLHFLAEGLRRGESALHFGFYEPPAQLVAQAELFAMPLGRWIDDGKLQLIWRPPAENILDALAYDLVVTARRAKVSRLVIDGLFGFRTSGYQQRLPGFCAVLNQELRALGITMLMTEEGHRLRLPGVHAQVASALFDNVVNLRSDGGGPAGGRTIRVRKARQAPHDNMSRAFTITDRGIVLAAVPSQSGGADRGVARGG